MLHQARQVNYMRQKQTHSTLLRLTHLCKEPPIRDSHSIHPNLKCHNCINSLFVVLHSVSFCFPSSLRIFFCPFIVRSVFSPLLVWRAGTGPHVSLSSASSLWLLKQLKGAVAHLQHIYSTRRRLT